MIVLVLFANSSVRSGKKTSGVGGWKQRERETVLGVFLTRQRPVFSDDAKQWLSRFGVEKEKMESWRCRCALVVPREREYGGACEGESLFALFYLSRLVTKGKEEGIANSSSLLLLSTVIVRVENKTSCSGIV
ncbi:hypothetical protein CMV_016838 [Castanea mollissima]|uniref:Uncharacterized protein n=1 Tax=Castanea mollissima TaxID=60419 RepID=A0A8J4QTH5_9ROSI|nr:hypothetical protein CMV_016838 [Castanea mollissima]